MYLFNGPKYITRGIQTEIRDDLQLLLWKLIEDRRLEKSVLDYLQVFDLSIFTIKGQQYQRITHHQEVPPFCHQIDFLIHQPVEAKIFVIDDIDHATMLLANEY